MLELQVKHNVEFDLHLAYSHGGIELCALGWYLSFPVGCQVLQCQKYIY